MRDCELCGAGFVSVRGDRRFCSDACSKAQRKPCEVSGCTRTHVARGLCGTHYNARIPSQKRYRKYIVSCAGCGTQVERTKQGARRPTCSQRCRYFVTFGRWPEAGKELAVYVRPMRFPHPVTAPRSVSIAETVRFVGVRCENCGECFVQDRKVTGQQMVFCTDRCQKRAHRRRRDGKLGRFRVSDLFRAQIYERDNDQCQICGVPVKYHVDVQDDWAPTLDHIVPQSAGGTDDAWNLRAAHRWCNSTLNDGRHYTEAAVGVAARQRYFDQL